MFTEGKASPVPSVPPPSKRIPSPWKVRFSPAKLGDDLAQEAETLTQRSATSAEWAKLLTKASQLLPTYPNELAEVAGMLLRDDRPVSLAETRIFSCVFGLPEAADAPEIIEALREMRDLRLRGLSAAALARQGRAAPAVIEKMCDDLNTMGDSAPTVVLPASIQHLTRVQLAGLLRRIKAFVEVLPAVVAAAAELPENERDLTFNTILDVPEHWNGVVDQLPESFLAKAIPAIRRLPEDVQVQTLIRVAHYNQSLRVVYLDEAWEVATGTRQDRHRAEYLTALAPYRAEKALAAAERVSPYYRLSLLCSLIPELGELEPLRAKAVSMVLDILQAAAPGRTAKALAKIYPHLGAHTPEIRERFEAVHARLLRTWATEPRPKLLENLRVIAGAACAVFRQQYARSVDQMLNDVTEWWP
jgi:hypothetical protein